MGWYELFSESPRRIRSVLKDMEIKDGFKDADE